MLPDKRERFQLLRKLGEGGMGVVFEAFDRARERLVGVKRLRRVDPNQLYWFKREFRALNEVSHPNIIRLYELVAEKGQWYLTMEIVHGVDFLTYIAQAPPQARGHSGHPDSTYATTRTAHAGAADAHTTGSCNTGETLTVRQTDSTIAVLEPVVTETRLTLDTLVDRTRLERALGQLAQVLYVLHAAGLSHRDLKPSNVLITPSGRLVLMDFGLVAELGQAHAAGLEGMAIGTPRYMAPEQIRGAPASAASDWYAVGVMLYRALTGQHPYEGNARQILLLKQRVDPYPPSLLVDGVPAHLEELCMALLSRQPDARPSGAEVLAALGLDIPVTVTTRSKAENVFVGRQDELRVLHDAYAAVQAGRAVCMLVEGISGIGKSRLIDRFIDTLQSDVDLRPLVFAGRCHERESMPYKALDGVIDSLSLYLLALSRAERDALLPADTHLISKLFPVFSRFLPDAAVAAAGAQDPLQQRVYAVAALRELLGRLAGAQPILLRIDDLQWVDPDSVELLGKLLARPHPARLMILATIRTEDLAAIKSGPLEELVTTLQSIELCQRLPVGPLSVSEQHELVYKLTGDEALAGRISSPAFRDWAGLPMLLVELARQGRDALAHLELDNRFALEDVIWQRVKLFSQPERDVLALLALANSPIAVSVLGHAAGLTDAMREQTCSALCAARMARVVHTADETRLDTYHDKVREAISRKLVPDQARRLHERLALAFDEWTAAPAEGKACHWLAAGDPHRAMYHLLEAADRAASQLAFERATVLFRQLLELLPESATGVAVDHMRCRAWVGLALGMRATDQYEEALALLERAEAVAARHNSWDELATIHYLHGSILYPRGDHDGCLAHHQNAWRYARQAGSFEHQAQALSGLGDAYYMRGEMSMARKHYRACIEICRDHGFTDTEPATLSMYGFAAYFLGDLAAALRDCHAATARASAVRNRRTEIVPRIMTAWILVDIGRFEEARHEFEAAIELARLFGARRFEGHCLVGLGNVLAAEGQRAEARALLERGIAVSRATGFAYLGPMALAVLAFATDDPIACQKHLAEGAALLEDGVVFHNHCYFYRYAIETAFRLGDLDAVSSYARGLEESTHRERLAWAEFHAARARALVALARSSSAENRPDEPASQPASSSDEAAAAAAAVLELRRLHEEALHLGYDWAARAIDKALDAGAAATGQSDDRA